MRKWPLLLGSLLFVGCAPSQEDTQDDQAQEAVVNGARTNAHAAIGMFTAGGSYCTGTLIAPNVVLTAAHCVEYHVDSSVRGQGFAFEIQRSNGAPLSYPVGWVHSLGRWSQAAEPAWRSEDIALLLLDKRVPASVATPLDLASSWPRLYSKVTVYGFGCTERATLSGGGEKRSATFAYGPGMATGLWRSSVLCPGDSGGPMLDANGRVIGVNSGFISGNDYFGDVPKNHDVLGGFLAQLSGL